MGQKTVRFSDLSGQLILDDHAPARIVLHEHPELTDSPVEIEALVEEARAIEDAGVPVAIVDIDFPRDEQPRRWLWRPTCSTSWPPTSPWRNCWPPPGPPARPKVGGGARRPGGPRQLRHARTRGQAAQRQDHRRGKAALSRRTSTRSTNGSAAENLRTISLTDPDHIERDGLKDLLGRSRPTHRGNPASPRSKPATAA